jgi:hypothetical protein
VSDAFWNGPTYAVIKSMKASGNQPGMVARWIATVAQWADDHRGLADAEALLAWLPHWQARDIYSVEELAPIFPALAIAFTGTKASTLTKSTKRLAHELKYGGLPHRKIDGVDYFAVARLHYWNVMSDAFWLKEIKGE